MVAGHVERRADAAWLGMVPTEFGDPSPQSIVAVKSLIVAPGLASVKLPTTVVLARRRRCWAQEGREPAVSGASAMTAVDVPVGRDRGGAAAVGDRTRRPGTCPPQAA